MLPIRFALSRRFCEASLFGLILLLGLGGATVAPLYAGPLPGFGVEDFRALIDPKREEHELNPEPAVAGSVLADYRRKLRRAAQDIPSLGRVARVLLLSEWSSIGFGFDERVQRDQIRKAVQQSGDEAFSREVRKLMTANPDYVSSINHALVAEIKEEVREQLLGRLENRTRLYLNKGRSEDRIAAANLVSDTLATSRRQDISMFRTDSGSYIPGVMHSTSKDVTLSSSSLRERLRSLSGDLEKLIADPNPQVRVAGIRALSDMEKTPADIVAVLKPLLTSRQSDAVTRRAAAEALGHTLEAYTGSMDRSRPLPYLKGVEQVLTAAADSLTDSDPLVRRASLEACQQAALVLDELASDPLNTSDRRPVFRPTFAVVNKVLPKLNACARDRVPELRVGACHVLETMALAVQKLRRERQGSLPATDPELFAPDPRPGKNGGKSKKKISLPPPRQSGPLLQTSALRTQQPDELPPPSAVEGIEIQESVQTMIANLKHDDYRVRLAAVDTLETYGKQAEAAIPALVSAMTDYNKFVRWSAARTLGRLHPRQPDLVVPGLMRMLDDREDPKVRIAAASALELYGEHAKKAVPTLAHVINRGDKDYVIAILRTIQAIGTDAAPTLPNVAWVLNDRTQPPSVRIEAAQTLGRFGALATEQLPILREVMNNEADEDIRNAASIAVLAVDRPLK